MASLQQKTCRGHKYWVIVESRRVNGKPRPIVLAHLGKAEELLRRLQQMDGHGPIKSYSHGAVAALLRLAAELDIPRVRQLYGPEFQSFFIHYDLCSLIPRLKDPRNRL